MSAAFGHADNHAIADLDLTVRIGEKKRTNEPAAFPVSVETLEARRQVAEILDRVLDQHGLSHAAVARKWDCSPSYVRAVRQGEKPLTLEKLVPLGDAGIDVLEQTIELIRRSGGDGPTITTAIQEVTIAMGLVVAAEVQQGDTVKAAVSLHTASGRLVKAARKAKK